MGQRVESPRSAAGSGRALVELWVLAAVPFVAKGLVLAFGVTGYGLQSLYKLFQLMAPCIWRRRWRSAAGMRLVWPTDEPLPSAGTWLLAVVVAVVLSGSGIAAAQWVLPLIEIDPVTIRAGLDARFPISATGAVLVVLFLSVANSALEELHFRAWMDRELSVRYGSTVGLSVSAGAFGAMHVLIFWGMPNLPVAALVIVPMALAVAGAAWSMIMRRPGGIHAAWLSHGLTDALLLGWGLMWLGYI